MTKIIDIQVPKETVSDDVYEVIKHYFISGAMVNHGDIVVSLETSKADFDIEAPASGYIFYNCKEKTKIKVGSVLAAICENNALPEAYFDRKPVEDEVSKDLSVITGINTSRISKKALSLIETNQIDPAVFSHLPLVRIEDVETYLNQKREIINVQPSLSSTAILILGGGNHTKVCIDLIRQSHLYQIIGILYTKFQPAYSELMDVPILGGLDKLSELFDQGVRLMALGIGSLDNPSERWDLFERVKKHGFYLPNLIHPKSIIEPSVVLEEGNQVMAGAVIGSCTRISSNCIINSNSVVSHDCMLENNVHVTPGALLAGTVRVGKHSIIGMGSSIYYGTQIGENTIITNGKHIYKDIGSNQLIK